MIDEFLKAFFDAIGGFVSYCLAFIFSGIEKFIMYILYYPDPQILYYRLAGFMMLFMITISLFSFYMNKRRRRLKKDKPLKFYNNKRHTIIINGGNNQIGNDNTQNNYKR
ncbi:hypothetical protein A3835_07805 [Campylobacter concisus]|uniref:Uncharacterized protein n=1 Tax=Campylobacter concisus TaxID=199 RepID=A0A1X0U1N9_9BACT|nr:hypothetical protein A3835_07805 [Campylobacter concisus]